MPPCSRTRAPPGPAVLPLAVLVVVTRLLLAGAKFDDMVALFRQSQQRVAADWPAGRATDLICASASFHGFVNKTDIGWHSAYLSSRVREFPGAGLPIYSHGMVYISFKYRFIYLRQPKSSSSTVMDYIVKTICKSKTGVCPRETLRMIPAQQISRTIWMRYFVFTIVRNPWTRIGSAFSFLTRYHMFKKAAPRAPPGEACDIPFAEFARNASALAGACHSQQCCGYVPLDRRWDDRYVGLHVTQQAHLVFNAKGASMVDYVGRTEYLSHDWREIMQHINRRENTAFKVDYLPEINHSKLRGIWAGVDECTNPYVAMYANETMIRDLAQQYALDVHMFGYLYRRHPPTRLLLPSPAARVLRVERLRDERYGGSDDGPGGPGSPEDGGDEDDADAPSPAAPNSSGGDGAAIDGQPWRRLMPPRTDHAKLGIDLFGADHADPRAQEPFLRISDDGGGERGRPWDPSRGAAIVDASTVPNVPRRDPTGLGAHLFGVELSELPPPASPPATEALQASMR